MIFPILEIFNICKFLRRSMMQHSICSCMFFITHVVCWMTKCPCNVLIIIYFLILYCSKFFHEMSSSYITIAPTLSNCPISYFAEYHPCRGGRQMADRFHNLRSLLHLFRKYHCLWSKFLTI